MLVGQCRSLATKDHKYATCISPEINISLLSRMLPLLSLYLHHFTGSLYSALTSFDRVLVPRPASPASARSSSPASAAGSLVPGPSAAGPAGLKVKRPSAQGVAKAMLLREKKKKGAMKELVRCYCVLLIILKHLRQFVQYD